MARAYFRIFLAALAVAGTACSSGVPTCADATLSREAQAALEAVAAQVDFSPVRPCGYGPGWVVKSVVVDMLPGAPPQRRISFIVERNGERSYVLSETRTPVTSTQIPQSAHRLRVPAGPVVAEGFAGPSGSGGAMTYLRWRTGGVTYELDATLGRALDEADAQRIATALMLRGSAAERPVSPTPSPMSPGLRQ